MINAPDHAPEQRGGRQGRQDECGGEGEGEGDASPMSTHHDDPMQREVWSASSCLGEFDGGKG